MPQNLTLQQISKRNSIYTSLREMKKGKPLWEFCLIEYRKKIAKQLNKLKDNEMKDEFLSAQRKKFFGLKKKWMKRKKTIMN